MCDGSELATLRREVEKLQAALSEEHRLMLKYHAQATEYQATIIRLRTEIKEYVDGNPVLKDYLEDGGL